VLARHAGSELWIGLAAGAVRGDANAGCAGGARGDPVGEAQVVRWCFAAATTVEMPLLNIALLDFTDPADAGAKAQRGRMVGWANQVLTGLNRWLDGREFVATDTFTVADILMSLTLNEVKDASLFEPYAHVRSYRARCQARAAWRRTFDSYRARVEAT
jgi:glutathione S-transferase